MTGCAIVFLIVGMAYRGQAWAWGVTIAIASLIIAALVHAAWFGVVWLFAQLPSNEQNDQAAVANARRLTTQTIAESQHRDAPLVDSVGSS